MLRIAVAVRTSPKMVTMVQHVQNAVLQVEPLGSAKYATCVRQITLQPVVLLDHLRTLMYFTQDV
jgi:hypothetical protein